MVMLIMSLDHVRDFFHITTMTDDPLNLQTTTPALFFTRWIIFLSFFQCHFSAGNPGHWL
jgi:uncharacterized membrane protein